MVIFSKFQPIFIVASFMRAWILKNAQEKKNNNKNTNQIVTKTVKVAVILRSKLSEN